MKTEITMWGGIKSCSRWDQWRSEEQDESLICSLHVRNLPAANNKVTNMFKIQPELQHNHTEKTVKSKHTVQRAAVKQHSGLKKLRFVCKSTFLWSWNERVSRYNWIMWIWSICILVFIVSCTRLHPAFLLLTCLHQPIRSRPALPSGHLIPVSLVTSVYM